MLKHVVLAAFLTCGAAAAYAQPQQAASPPAPSATAPADATMAPTATADTRKLIGRNVKNAQDETIGEIKSIYIDKSGKVDSVIVGVGGFLGVGDREVRIAWSDLKISDNGEKVMVNMTKDDLKAKPEYKYGNDSWRGQVFTDTGPWSARPSDAPPSDARPSDARPADAPKPMSDRMADTTKPVDRTAAAERSTTDRPSMAATTSTGDFNASGEMSTNAIIGASVRNENRETVGKVEDVYVDNSGAIKTVVVSVGGFLGVGSKNVAVKWSDLKFSRDDKSIAITTNWTKDSLKAMPDYKYERQQPASRSGG